MSEIQELQAEIAEWANSIIPDRTPHEATVKLMMEEVPEFCLNPAPGEFADLVILIFDIAYLMNIDIHKAVLDKMEENRKREWVIDPRTKLMKHKR